MKEGQNPSWLQPIKAFIEEAVAEDSLPSDRDSKTRTT